MPIDESHISAPRTITIDADLASALRWVRIWRQRLLEVEATIPKDREITPDALDALDRMQHHAVNVAIGLLANIEGGEPAQTWPDIARTYRGGT